MGVISDAEGSLLNPVLETAAAFQINNVTVTSLASGLINTTYLAAAPLAYGVVNIAAKTGAIVNVTEPFGAAGTVNLIADGGTINLSASGVTVLQNTTATISNGGTFNETGGSSFGLLNSGSISFGTGGGVLGLTAATPIFGAAPQEVIGGFKPGDTIIDNNVLFASAASYTVANANGYQTVTFNNAAGVPQGSIAFRPGTFAVTGKFANGAGPLRVSSARNGNAQIDAACFLKGTHIAGVNGDVRVEDLNIGDAVKTLLGGKIVMKPVSWVGHRQITVAADAGDDEFPVRIRAHAFANEVPCRDLWLTAEHCILVEGQLVPVRMLVNGGSILIDRNVAAFTYYHVELAAHGVLLAEGLAAESYLDSGNRSQFANAPIVALNPVTQPFHDAAVKLAKPALRICTDCDFVEPVWTGLQKRALARGQGRVRRPRALIADPGLQVETEDGVRISPYSAKDGRYGFAVPAGTLALTLISRASAPSEIIGPYMDDRRKLGVLVRAVRLETGHGSQLFEPHKQHVLNGWHATEAGCAMRWTDGRADLALDVAGLASLPGILHVDIAHAGPYVRAAQQERKREASFIRFC